MKIERPPVVAGGDEGRNLPDQGTTTWPPSKVMRLAEVDISPPVFTVIEFLLAVKVPKVPVVAVPFVPVISSMAKPIFFCDEIKQKLLFVEMV